VYLNGVRIAAVAPSGSASYYLTDQVDSVTVVLDDGGKIVTQHEYLPFGETWITEGDKKNAPKYNSQELDKETGYYFYNARHYDAEIGRFVTPDTVIDGETDTQGWNRYTYTKNNPIIYKDPTGHDVVVLQSKTGAHSRGHSAILVEIHEGEYKGKWMYVSKNGTSTDGSSSPGGVGGVFGEKDPSKWQTNLRHRNHFEIFKSPEDFFKEQQRRFDIYKAVRNTYYADKASNTISYVSDETLSEMKEAKPVIEYVNATGTSVRYEEGLRIRTTKSQDAKIGLYQLENLDKRWYLEGRNCNDLVDDSLDKHIKTSNHPIPNSWFKEMKDLYKEEGKKNLYEAKEYEKYSVKTPFTIKRI
jgi:RHS repeat-associated protein